MNELQQIVRAIETSTDELFLATVVDVVGSAYRRPSARMLVLPEDRSESQARHIGTISGGCLERDLCRAASELTKMGPKLVSFDTRTDSINFNPRYNTGCAGIVYVLVERITRSQNCPSNVLRSVFDARTARVCATIYQTDTRELGTVGGRLFAPPATMPAEAFAQFTETWNSVQQTGHPVCCELTSGSGSTRMLIEKISPPKPIWIFGGGDDARPLAAMATNLGWDVTVIDHQPSRITQQRFPTARRIHLPWHAVMDALTPTEQTAAVLLTHSFSADKQLLPRLLKTNIPYVGVLGPKSRTGKILRELHSEGELPASKTLDRLHTPVGLDLGATTSSEVAISILSEIVAMDHGRDGTRLANRQGPIHHPVRHTLIELGPVSKSALATSQSGQTAKPHPAKPRSAKLG